VSNISDKIRILRASLEGDIYDDHKMRTLYATDASVYREMPLAVAMPKHKDDICQLVHFAKTEQIPLIPRAAGTSLAGQCVGEGIVVDTSRYMTEVLEVNKEEGWVRVQPGVVRDELNIYLKPYGLFFGPNTSTSNRAMIGGMVGNNSCGSYSIVYGTTRDHVMELQTILSDGSKVAFKDLSPEEFQAKCELDSLEGQVYRHIHTRLSDAETQLEITSRFPAADIHRRNTGYAVDLLLDTAVFSKKDRPFNMCKLLAGSEGTLAFTTEIKLHVDPLPPSETGLLCVHFSSVTEALKGTLVAMQHTPRAVELMDKIVMDCTKENRMYQKNRFFIEGAPAAILIVEVGGENQQEVENHLLAIEDAMRMENLGYSFPRVMGKDIKKVWDLRKAGLGLLSNVPGDAKPVAVIEDTAVRVEDLPAYIDEFSQMMGEFGQQAVYYAHAGAGELHLRPLLNLKDPKDVVRFHEIGSATANLVKKFNGSLSGEHGDGRVRAEFIPLMVGEKNYQLFKEIKQVWDPQNIFNPGKIVDAPAMNTSLRYEPGQETPQFDTIFDFSDTDGILRAAEKCNGSGDCRKSHLSGGTMCPSYMATRNEKDTTRARANILREFLTRSPKKNKFAHEEIYEVMDLCLSCKGCTSECPSNVDMALMKAEFLYQYYKTHGVPLRAKAFANIGKINRMASIAPGLHNFLLKNPITSSIAKKVLGVAPPRTIPALYQTTLRKWYDKNQKRLKAIIEKVGYKRSVYFYCDEFTNYLDTEVGIKALELLAYLGYEAHCPPHADSGRAHISKGLLKAARGMAMYNVDVFRNLVTEDKPLVGIEPSAILTFRDEYPKLVIPEYYNAAEKLSNNSMMIDEFLAAEIQKGNITPEAFTSKAQKIKLHGHCHQKALSTVKATEEMLKLPKAYTVEEIPSGCCGMAGSFGYEKEHYEVSMNIGELVLFPAVKQTDEQTLIAAPGTSCRHQIYDGTGKKALHPVEILYEALLDKSSQA